ncbi:MAG: putative quinol monooxygenase [Candidatus Kapaibacterium sp.]
MSADNHVYWVLEAGVKEGKLDELKSLVSEMVQTTKESEPGALHYEFSLSEDGTRCHIHERYADSEATLTHLKNFGENFAGRFMDALEIKRFNVYGNPDEIATKALSKLGVAFMPSLDGFVRGHS